ncbi:mucosa-associated lymphoid tissue lymphoma translocation protein 1-like [Rhodnius prolixus]|uniref:Putative caspase domain protein n=1 Tax=Rhodnius neglectus TaxID=72488 RepID=A0A0N7Z9N1_9HEMI
MNFDQYLLEDYKTLQPQLYRGIVDLLNDNDSWKLIVSALTQYRIKICLPVHKVKKMEMGHSPAEELFDELIIRACTLQHFKELLRFASLTNILALISEPEPLDIVKQPGEDDEVVYVCFNDELCLECEAVGLPPPKYQWYHDNIALEKQTNSNLRLLNFSFENEGDYYCTVSHYIGDNLYEVTSHSITAYLMDAQPEFVQQPPTEIIARAGADINLIVQVACNSRYSLQWMFGNLLLPGETNAVLVIKNVSKEHAGKYRCVAKNASGEVFTMPSALKVEYEAVRPKQPTAKIALLIANEKYENYPHLSTPVNDVILLNEKLTQLKFRVITLMNLTRNEMINTINWFFQITPPGSYVFICFIAHGFMLSNNKFIMPVDCPDVAEYKMADCICDELLVMKAKENKLKLLVMLFDACLKVPCSEENPHIFEERAPGYLYQPYAGCHVVKIFSTASHQSAYEDPKSVHGFYVEHIAKYITRDYPIISNFLLAHEDFGKKKLNKVQTPCLTVDGGHKIKFTDEACESSDFIEKIEAVFKLNSRYELNFNQLGIQTELRVFPHRRKVLNALDLYFSPQLMPWDITVHISPTVFVFDFKKYKEGLILNIFDLQKAKSDLYITILFGNSENKDTAIVDLGLPLFATAKVWYDPIR